MKPFKETSWKMFDAISPTYDRINAILSLGMDRRWRRRLASYLPSRSNLDLLDLASGTASQLVALFENKAPIRSAIGIDLSSEMLKIGKQKIQEKPYCNRVQFQVADATRLPFAEKSFDAATFSFGIRNVPDPILSLKEIHRVLKPGGRCLILEFSLPPEPLKTFHLFYLRRILPYIGGFLSKNREAYRYLNETIETFPYGDAFARLMKSVGFSSLKQVPMALGAVTLYMGDKK
jgi:demethylmenaquinone methyltransferase/2-methoxy-6-polyprenyl-1,4-benzoquinol methylase